MKKQILTLMLSAAVFTTTPLLAMKEEFEKNSSTIQVLHVDEKLFSEKKDYPITAEHLQLWMKEQKVHQEISIEGRKFRMDNSWEGEHHLDRLHPKSHLMCVWMESMKCFLAAVSVSDYSDSNKIQDLDSEEYCNGVNLHFNMDDLNHYAANSFEIKEKK